MKIAAIDIGSNAARLLINEVQQKNGKAPSFNKVNLLRVPLRLGFDVFNTSRISAEKESMMLETLKAFKHLLNAYQVKDVIACATSAMRDAANSREIIARIKKETDISIEIISGEEEANLVFENHIAESLDKEHSYLYIDVGGGSTELSFFSNGELQANRSFNVGTIRLLQEKVKEETWDELKAFAKTITKGHKEVAAIGSGGNINKIFSLSKTKEKKPLRIELLKEYHQLMEPLELEDRISIFNLREDRADVIVPALRIYISVMRWAGAEEIYVPKIGLADGLIHHLWDQLSSSGKVGKRGELAR